MGDSTMSFEAAQNQTAASPDERGAERGEALRLLGLTDSPPAPTPNLPNLPDTAGTEICGFVVRIGSST